MEKGKCFQHDQERTEFVDGEHEPMSYSTYNLNTKADSMKKTTK